jgi:hypothetical protein
MIRRQRLELTLTMERPGAKPKDLPGCDQKDPWDPIWRDGRLRTLVIGLAEQTGTALDLQN